MSVRKPVRVVPRAVMGAAFVGVIPACALIACGGDVVTAPTDSGPDTFLMGVGAVAYCCFETGPRPDAADASHPDGDGDAGEAGDAHDGG